MNYILIKIFIKNNIIKKLMAKYGFNVNKNKEIKKKLKLSKDLKKRAKCFYLYLTL